ncbi:hypothetical protein J0X19_01330 [Hymenobacter sp. BT186]|uniref:Uncharacterized protein n=1 Tax=Hymenobacter telluris TaxID=2816474 RepID=A0A939JAT3_9BACT|nr:hypothetical protein [Hymenobacter telluris]MBO0356575.1 hypothetical protein [Hymenobacter telluris]MBW3372600.1 hypothetical protein [Hymenobacter norwichensis]
MVLGLLLPVAGSAQGPAAANKRLFDRTVEELNFRTMETVYDKSFTRRKFPVSLRTAKARKDFNDFDGRADLQKLFQNYNGVSERYKNRFGQGRTDLAQFEKQLRSILVDKNFEFFIRVLPRDERVSLIRGLERYIQQSAAQFNASEDAAPEELAADGAAVPPADVDAPLTSSPPEESPSLTAAATTPTAPLRSIDTAVQHDWVDYLTLLLSGASTLLLLFVVTSVLPELRNRLDTVTDELDRQQGATVARRQANTLPEDRYDDEDEN